MKIETIGCGTLRVHGEEMHNHLPKERIGKFYRLDRKGYMRIAMNAMLVDTGSRVVLFDPGCAAFLPSRFVESYGLEIEISLENSLSKLGYLPGQVSDVIFTHLHFDHGSGAFVRVPGKICKRFPEARYHVLREHYTYARKPDKRESNSFATGLFKYLDELYWLEDWKEDWMQIRIFHGHTRAMVVPGIASQGGWAWYVSDLIPLQTFLAADVSSAYDLDPELARKEKVEFLEGLDVGTELIFYHDPLVDRKIYP
jgi:glyoxylase-like metal-dependent hydrolase (beta-lactamase superfamily II)